MKIALLDMVEWEKKFQKHAKERKHKIAYILDKGYQEGEINNADVAINFSVPDAAVSNIRLALEKKIPVVCGTTGWLKDYDLITSLCKSKKVLFYMHQISV